MRSARWMSTTGAHEGHHDAHHSHDSHHAEAHDPHHADHHDSHHAPEDPNFYYNKYGPFHHYTFLNQPRPEDPHNTDHEDPYRNEVQGYMFTEDPSDTRRDPARGGGEAFLAYFLLICVLSCFPRRSWNESSLIERNVGDALVTAQFIERFINEHKAKE